MALMLYLATAAAVLWLVQRFVRPISRAASVVLVALPFAIVGYALITGGVYGPVDHAYEYPPLSAFAEEHGIGPARNASAIDIWSEFFPWRLALKESLARGEWPLWTGYNLAGHPLAAEAQSAPYSPFTLIACLLPAMLSQTYSLAIALFIAGLSAFLFARELGCGEGASLIAAAGWGLASCTGSRLTAMGFATAYAPLLLAAVRRVVWTPGVASGALLLITLSLTVLAGHPESLFLNVLVGCAYASFELIRRRATPWRAIATAFVAGVLTLLLCAIALLPLIEAIPQSHDYELKSEVLAKARRGVPGAQAAAAMATNFFPYLHIRYWMKPRLGYIAPETTAVGSILLALAVYAVWRRRSPETWFFAGLGLFCLLTGARWAPIAETLHKLPLFNITLHDRLAFHGAICLIALAALGVEHCLRTNDRRAVMLTMAATLVLVTGGTVWLQRNIVLAVTPTDYGRYRIGAEIVFLGAAVLLLATRTRVFLPALLALVVAQRALSEIDTFPNFSVDDAYPPIPMLEPLKQIREPFRIVGRGLAFPPATNIFYGLDDVRGYETHTLYEYVNTWHLWCRVHGIWFNRVDDLTAPFLSLLNVRFAIQEDALPVPPGWRIVGRQKGAVLLENDNVIDRIFVPPRIAMSDAHAVEVVDRMAQVPDLRKLAWITSRSFLGEKPNGPGQITLRSWSRGGEYVFDADMENEGYVVITDAAWKGWRAYVDGRRERLRRANGAFLSVLVPRGRHTVRLVYWPTSFVQGRAITMTTLMLIIAVAFIAPGRRRTAA